MKRIVFLDRDGVINRLLPNDYVKTWDEFVFIPDCFSAICLLNEHGYDVIVVSNQAGVSKGLYTASDLYKIDQNMKSEMEAQGAHVMQTYYCIHTDRDCCLCRKPKSGLFIQAGLDFDINFSESWIIGDAERDILAGKTMGCHSILITKRSSCVTQADYIRETIFDAVNVIV